MILLATREPPLLVVSCMIDHRAASFRDPQSHLLNTTVGS